MLSNGDTGDDRRLEKERLQPEHSCSRNAAHVTLHIGVVYSHAGPLQQISIWGLPARRSEKCLTTSAGPRWCQRPPPVPEVPLYHPGALICPCSISCSYSNNPQRGATAVSEAELTHAHTSSHTPSPQPNILNLLYHSARIRI